MNEIVINLSKWVDRGIYSKFVEDESGTLGY